MNMTVDELISELMDNDMTVFYTAADGSAADMLCTLAEDIVPESNVKIRNGDNIRVYDLVNEEWANLPFSRISYASPVAYS
jgi:hypothetical protein